MSAAVNVAYGPGIPLEVSQTFTPLGLRFWDLTQNLPIADGLWVNLQLENSQAPALPAVLTRSGVYAFFGLPGLYAVEHPTPASTPAAPQTWRYVVTVRDRLNRYLPAVLVYTLDQNGAVLVQGVPDSTNGARIAQLFSSVSRPVPPGFGAIFADLTDHDTNEPAAWAVIQVQISGQTEVWTGIADEAGRALVLVPYPVMQSLVLGSPPGSGQGSIAGQSWTVTITAQYSPDQLTYPAAGFSDVQWPWTDTPSLKDILGSQGPATIWTDSVTQVSQMTATLNVGEDLVLSTVSGSPPSPTWSLSISRSSSPP